MFFFSIFIITFFSLIISISLVIGNHILRSVSKTVVFNLSSYVKFNTRSSTAIISPIIFAILKLYIPLMRFLPYVSLLPYATLSGAPYYPSFSDIEPMSQT